MVSCAEKSRLWAGFSRLSEEKKSEILGMAEAFAYAQQFTGPDPANGGKGSSPATPPHPAFSGTDRWHSG
jgi:hypothetical protein